MKLLVINLKENMPTVELAIANLEIELDFARQNNISAIKLIHGYGSHGSGGAIFNAVKAHLNKLLKQKKYQLLYTEINGVWKMRKQEFYYIIIPSGQTMKILTIIIRE